MIHRMSPLIRYRRVITLMTDTSTSSLIEPSGGASGQATDISIHAKEILRIRESLTNMYADHCTVEGETREEARARFGEFPTRPIGF